MPNAKDYTGQRFGKLTAIRDAGSAGRQGRMWLCRCDCGGEKLVPVNKLLSVRIGKGTGSCGCVRGNHKKQHPAYIHWTAMKQRVRDRSEYRHVSICDEWQSSTAFLKWAEQSGWKPGLTLDRVDPWGNYSPENCRWATDAEQVNNRRNTIKVTWRGEVMPLKGACELEGVNYCTARSRLAAGRTLSEALAPKERRAS